MQQKYALVLPTSVSHDYLDESPEYAIIPTSSSILRKYQALLNTAQNSEIPNFSHYGIIDYSLTLVNHNYDETQEFTKRNVLPTELQAPVNRLGPNGPFVIPMPTEDELDEYAVRVELPYLEVHKHLGLEYNGYLKHTNIRWFTTHGPDSKSLPDLIEFMEKLEETNH